MFDKLKNAGLDLIDEQLVAEYVQWRTKRTRRYGSNLAAVVLLGILWFFLKEFNEKVARAVQTDIDALEMVNNR